MFHRLKYSVTFPSTGRTLSADLEFDAGFWAITGSNESGKSTILEMLRVALFGVAAARGPAADYKTLELECEFTARGQRYTVVRGKSVLLKRDGEAVASGTTAVNSKVVEILGFGLHVFDTACSINQGEVERLGSMKPTERKALVDSVLGINALDIVAKWGADEARLLEKEAETLQQGLRVPTEPAAPVPYVPGIDIEAHRAAVRLHAELTGWLSHSKPEPVMPIAPVTDSLDYLAERAKERRQLRERVAQLEALIAARPASVPYTAEQLNAAEAQAERYQAYVEAQTWIRMHPKPADGRLEQLQQWLVDWALLLDWDTYDDWQRRLRDVEHQLSHAATVDCPSCGQNFPLAADAYDELKERQRKLAAYTQPEDPRPAQPPLSQAQCDREMQEILAFDFPAWAERNAVPAADPPLVPSSKINLYRGQLEQVVERQLMEADLAATRKLFDEMPDYESMLLQRRAYEHELAAYLRARDEYKSWLDERKAKEAQLAELVIDPDAEINYQAAREYERDLEQFQKEVAAYDATVAKVEDLQAQAEKYRKVRELMNVLRSLIKQHLMPSLNRVASYLLHQMTGGQRSQVFVDEDFNITIDRQRLETLSGSGKACANLALRLALGQVLTNKVLSVLLADEIDASMDEFRSEQTAKVLGTIQSSISQVLLVSHKSIEANNHIHLGGFIDDLAGGAA